MRVVQESEVRPCADGVRMQEDPVVDGWARYERFWAADERVWLSLGEVA